MIAVSTITAALKKELGSYFSTEAHRDNDIVRYINSAARAITIERNFQFWQKKTDLVVTNWITEYDIPFQIETFFVQDSAWEDVAFEDFLEYNKLRDKTWIVWIWGDKAECNTPWTYTIFHRGYPTEVTSLSDSLNIPSHFYDLVVIKAAYFGFMDIRAYDKAGTKKTIFDGMIKSLATRSSNPQPSKTKRLNKWKSKAW